MNVQRQPLYPELPTEYRWNSNIEIKYVIVRYMKDHACKKDATDRLQQEYGNMLPVFPVTTDDAGGDVP